MTISEYSSFKNLEIIRENEILIVKMNRPNRKNAINSEMYDEIAGILEVSSKDSALKVLVLTGNGDYFSSGNDLSVFMSGVEDVDAAMKEAAKRLTRFVEAFIHFPKTLIAAVNGPAIGIACTILGHCDFVYASERATFNTPFSALAQSPEGCSSYLFPRIMGHTRANEILVLGKKFDAKEALEARLVGRVFPHDQLMKVALESARTIASFQPETLADGKALIRSEEMRKKLSEVNRKEVEVLTRRWVSHELMEAIAKFYSGKTKSNL
eukprot:TRINITY_DN5874_c0_g1_i1.p1 TRINITY_DN5874_c0_g1~~TRINITY_DN5874_c0_g1_i1.p1  ORF type:complete len:286 (-),score=94.82 TRINITY_DN5874_c0_g1_i1:72-875(-)